MVKKTLIDKTSIFDAYVGRRKEHPNRVPPRPHHAQGLNIPFGQIPHSDLIPGRDGMGVGPDWDFRSAAQHVCVCVSKIEAYHFLFTIGS